MKRLQSTRKFLRASLFAVASAAALHAHAAQSSNGRFNHQTGRSELDSAGAGMDGMR